MSSFAIGIIIGIFVGAAIGFLAAGLLSAAKCDDCKYSQREQ